MVGKNLAEHQPRFMATCQVWVLFSDTRLIVQQVPCSQHEAPPGAAAAALGVQPSLRAGAPPYPGNVTENMQELQAFPVTRSARSLPPFDFHAPS